jgi:hypothetical protein
MSSGASPRPTVAQVFLGLFIVWQLIFLFVANSLELVISEMPPPNYDLVGAASEPDPNRPAKDAVFEVLSRPARRWAELTGQIQGWGLFAPVALPQTTYLQIKMHWDADPGRDVTLRSLFAHEDPKHYLRLPGMDLRLHNHEWRLAGMLMFYQLPGYENDPVVWRNFLRNAVRCKNGFMRAYLRLRLQQYMREHPDQPPPDEIVFAVHLVRSPISEPDQPPIIIDMPLARWRPQAPDQPGVLPVEVFNPMTRQFEPLAPFPE